MRTVYLLAVWLHILAVVVWLGGMAFLVLVFVPIVRKPELRAQAPALFHLLGTRFRPVGWACLITLLVTGTIQLGYRGYGWEDLWTGRLFAGPLGHALALKLAIVAVILVLSAVHDFVVGPRATVAALPGASAEARERLRRQASRLGRTTFVLALVATALGVVLVRGLP
ncbi:MAG TPA: DUF4149 domain-containing protein [Thermodesulfobacteriota bacterium]